MQKVIKICQFSRRYSENKSVTFYIGLVTAHGAESLRELKILL